MLTLNYIIRRTPKQRRDDAAFVRILATKTGYTPRGTAFFAAQTVSTRERLPDGRIVSATGKTRYVTVIEILNVDKLYAKVSCSCPDFMYRAEVALHDRGAADIEYSNGDQPVFTNPQLIPMCCKHLVKVHDVLRVKIDEVVRKRKNRS